MKKKVFKRTEVDCGTASLATLLDLPYEEVPAPYNGFVGEYVLFNNGRFIARITNVGDWFEARGLKIKAKKGRFWWGYSMGVIAPGEVIDPISGYPKAHMVVMKGRRIWHDPEIEGSSFKNRDVTYSMKISPEATP